MTSIAAELAPAVSRSFRRLLFGTTAVLTLSVSASGQPDASEPFRFEPHVIDTDLAGSGYGQTALVDLDADGRLEFVMGRRSGDVLAYKYQAPVQWTRFVVGKQSPSDVGLAPLDVDSDGRMDLVAGGVWYRNGGRLDRPFERIVFDAELAAVHDIATADVNGDGRLDVLTMSDKNNLRWYEIGTNAKGRWKRTDIGAAVHAGLAPGDLDGDGDTDVVRTDVWFENIDGRGATWREHPLGPNTPPPQDFQPPFAFNATRAVVRDMNGDRKLDIVQTDNEIPGGKIWWMENRDGAGRQWRRHDVFTGGEPRRGAFHTLQVLDFDGDGDLEIFTCEMEAVRGRRPPRWYIWENLGRGTDWREHVVLDQNLGGHEAVVGDVTGDGRPDIVGKPWNAHRDNALGGKMFVVFLHNLADENQ